MAQLKAYVKRILRWHDVSDNPTVRQPPRSEQPLAGPAAEMLAHVQRYFWFHSIDLGNGIVTPGSKSPDVLRAEAEAIFGPLALRGKSVLDIGAWNGYFSFRWIEQTLGRIGFGRVTLLHRVGGRQRGRVTVRAQCSGGSTVSPFLYAGEQVHV